MSKDEAVFDIQYKRKLRRITLVRTCDVSDFWYTVCKWFAKVFRFGLRDEGDVFVACKCLSTMLVQGEGCSVELEPCEDCARYEDDCDGDYSSCPGYTE